jgi:hypothetical protein
MKKSYKTNQTQVQIQLYIEDEPPREEKKVCDPNWNPDVSFELDCTVDFGVN